MRFIAALALLTLTACSSASRSEEEQSAELAQATDACLADPALARKWGECNVKSTIYQRAEAIGQCQAKFSRAGSEPLMLKIRLRPNGKVRNVWAEEGKAQNKELEQCLAKEIARLKFASPPKGVEPVIYFPFQQ